MTSGPTVVRASGLLTAALTTAIIFAGCASDKIVFRDRQPFNNPPAAALGFLGYFDSATKQTTCGNCHAEIQGSWKGTKHASAWANLNASTAKAAECYGCHTVNGRGNAAVNTVAGYDAVKQATYNDVQCESCHGAGLTHVEGVGQATLIKPLAKISMTGTGNCGDCHTGAHTPFAEEWKASGHGKVTTRGANADCAGCHDGRGALKRWGVTDDYQEKADPTNYQAVTCAVCHNPHGSENPHQLRFSLTSTDPAQNLCMQCHLRRIEPEFTASTPHAPQGAVLLGFAGYKPPGFEYDSSRIYGSHATTRNQKLCAGCHISKFTVTDKLTGAFTFQATGHLMRPIPCLDAAGKPTGDKTCPYTATARSWQTCTVCHGSAEAAANAFNSARDLMKFLADQLWTNLNNDGTLQAAPTDGGLLATLKATRPTEWSNTDNRVTPAEGAEFNARLCGEYNQANSDNSKGTHNRFLCQALLVATIDYVRSYYSLPAASREVQARIDSPIGGEYRSSMRVSRMPPR